MSGQYPEYYITGKGDTFYKIAQTFLDNGKEWPRVYRLSRYRCCDPNQLTPGTMLWLPLAD